jgi:cellulose synthase/poly-beta-1,6-N-acetylglucosamine synthase-like glycosyltransferase
MITAILSLYWFAVAALFLYGINCYVLCRQYRRNRERQLERVQSIRDDYWRRHDDHDLPFVTIQLPIYNERFVVGRLIDAMVALDWPVDRLQIQILDDSTDDTTDIVSEHIRALAVTRLSIDHIHRSHREGFKAGALRDGLLTARGDLVAIFDADFVPEPDFLRQTIPFFENDRVGLVQARWGHINRELSALTRAQGLAIDGHFAIEQAGRCWGGWMLNFNGTAGVWRRAAIDDAGGWRADTLTEDLDLSYRAQLRGWKVEFLPDVEVPAEIPADITAFKSQQRRWAKGSIQTACKLLPSIFAARLPIRVKVQAVAHLTHYLVHPLMLAVALLAPPLLLNWEGAPGPITFGVAVVLLIAGTCGPTTLYVTSQRALHPDWLARLKILPMLMVLGTGIAVSNTRAVFEALLGIRSGFVRTPKANLTSARPTLDSGGYRLPIDPLFLLELALAGYAVWGLVLYMQHGKWLIGPFLLLYACGFGTVGFLSAKEALGRLRSGPSSGMSRARKGRGLIDAA